MGLALFGFLLPSGYMADYAKIACFPVLTLAAMLMIARIGAGGRRR